MTQDDVLFGYRLQPFDLAGRIPVSAACRTFGVHRSTWRCAPSHLPRLSLIPLRHIAARATLPTHGGGPNALDVESRSPPNASTGAWAGRIRSSDPGSGLRISEIGIGRRRCYLRAHERARGPTT